MFGNCLEHIAYVVGFELENDLDVDIDLELVLGWHSNQMASLCEVLLEKTLEVYTNLLN